MIKMIEVNLLKSVIEGQVNNIEAQLNGKMLPTLTKYEALRELGSISSLVISLYDRIADENLKEEVWKLKESADDLYQKLMGF